ncbi:hypothetical protein DFH07DRAFT_857854 [Mycena maculata]|uniref:Transmembrane protein n=1 Tax=Mycena maculata TaxID=230809 RepID=A0AAD7MKT6_9AGAR|nr:hypothetical protein DFH07DRAFT_857854 [Mycena maculata]
MQSRRSLHSPMILSPYLILFSGLWISVFGLSVPGVPGQLQAYSIASSHQDLMVQKHPGTDAEATTSTLWKRAAHPNRSTTITIVVGVIGGVALVAAVFLGILLFMRSQRDRQRARDSTSKAHDIEFPAANQSPAAKPDTFPPQPKDRPYYASEHVPAQSPPQVPRRPDNMQSGWFLDTGNEIPKTAPPETPERVKTPSVRPTVTRKTSRPRFDAEQNSTIPENPAPATTSSRTRRSESDSTSPGRSDTRNLPPSLPQLTHEPERPPSPVLFLQMENVPSVQRVKTVPSRQTVTGKTSRPIFEAEQTSAIPEKATPATTSSRTRRSESESTPRVSSDPPTVEILFLPSFPPSRPSSPILFRQPDQSITVSPRPRNASLPRSRPDPIIPPLPAAVGHVTSVSEDIRPVSRFSVSPVARSFPSRLTLTSPTGNSTPSSNRTSRGRRQTRLHGFGSLPNLANFRSDAPPDVPTDIRST